MILRHEREPVDGQPVENTFVAIDERNGEVLGSSVIYVDYNPVLYPVRPLQVRIQLDGMPVPDSLLGATIARAKELCIQSNSFSRIYVRCAPDDQQLLSSLTPFGFKDDDGLIRMQLSLPANLDCKAPAGCAVVYDDLSEPQERRYFLERYNQLYNVDHDLAWLCRFIDRPDFMRILTVAPTGMAGEILIWREGSSGVIGYLQTSRRWRRLGVASYMLSLACEAFEQQNLLCAEASIRARYPHMLRVMSKAGFAQTELLMRYPGIDLNPDDD